MKKYTLLLLVSALTISSVVAQDRVAMRPADRFIISPFTDIWTGLPDGLSTQAINRGISIDYMQEFPLGTSNFSAAVGLGFSSHNMYSNHVYFDSDTTGDHRFIPVGEIYSNEYSNNKISLNYINLPLELRFRTRNTPRTFRVHAGLKAGVLVSGHTKYVGEIAPGRRETLVKEKRLENIPWFLVGFHGRIGYGRINLHTYLSLTDVFTDNNASDATIMSLGLSFILF